jgi:rhodanese-related sulfurtransferase
MKNITPAELADLLTSPPDGLMLLDVRTPAEYHGLGHLDGAVNFPVQAIEQWAPTINPQQPVVLLCQHGRRSEFAAQYLSQQGHQATLYNLTEGMSVWDGDVVLPA